MWLPLLKYIRNIFILSFHDHFLRNGYYTNQSWQKSTNWKIEKKKIISSNLFFVVACFPQWHSAQFRLLLPGHLTYKFQWLREGPVNEFDNYSVFNYASMQRLFQMRNSSHQTLSMIPVVYCLLEATPPSLFSLTKISVTKSLVTYLYVILLYPDPCLTNPCRSGGLCRRTDAGYECDCPQDYTGTNCETYAPTGKILSIY